MKTDVNCIVYRTIEGYGSDDNTVGLYFDLNGETNPISITHCPDAEKAYHIYKGLARYAGQSVAVFTLHATHVKVITPTGQQQINWEKCAKRDAIIGTGRSKHGVTHNCYLNGLASWGEHEVFELEFLSKFLAAYERRYDDNLS